MKRFFKGVNKKEAISWALYDFANSSYGLIILTFVFPIYYKEVIAGNIYGDFYWGLIGTISILIAGLTAPVIGAIADYDSRKKNKFILFSIIAIIGTSALYFTGSNMLIIASLLFIATHIFYDLALILYDSFLPSVSSKETVGRISGLGYGLGYLGGIIAMLALKPLYEKGYIGELASMYKLTFPLTALFFLIFALPAFFFIKGQGSQRKESFIKLTKIGFNKVFKTLKEIKNHKKIAWFLIAFYFMNDALVTLFAFISLYARTTFSLSIKEIGFILLLVQVIAIPAAIFFGWLGDKKGQKRILLSTLVVWCLIIILLTIANSKNLFYFIAILTGLVIGGSQAIARSWLSKLIPPEKQFEFFGFNGFASKIGATIGPLTFGAISSFTGNQRIAMLALLPFFIISLIIFARIKEDK